LVDDWDDTAAPSRSLAVLSATVGKLRAKPAGVMSDATTCGKRYEGPPVADKYDLVLSLFVDVLLNDAMR